MEQEIWRPVVGYENIYEVSSLGRVKSINKDIIMRTQKTNGGYLYVKLYNNGIGKTMYVHRLVASAFIENPENLPHVNHRNEVKTDNMVRNLEWITPYDNVHYGSGIQRRADKESKAVLCVELNVIFKSAREAERQSGIDESQISSCCLHKIHYNTAGGYHWEYVKTNN